MNKFLDSYVTYNAKGSSWMGRPGEPGSNDLYKAGCGNNRMPGIHPSDWRPMMTGLAPRPPSLLVLGASGHVAQAFLLRLQQMRARFGRVLLLDASDTVTKSVFLDHGRLAYHFIQRRLKFPHDIPYYQQLLVNERVDIVADLTDLDTMPVLEATDAVGVSYVNTAINDAKRGVADVVSMLHPTREARRSAPHILSSGMNPGVVNIWVWHAYHLYGAPEKIIHFEYDTSEPVSGWRPMVTWSRQEFLTECIWERTGHVVKGKLRQLPGNSLQYAEDMRAVLKPVMDLPKYPRGLLVLHEENVKLGAKLRASSKYLYAIHPRTMEYLERLWRAYGRVDINDLQIGDNTTVPLKGADTIGVCLKYPKSRVYFLHSLENEDVAGTNATCAQVAVGVEAALTTVLSANLQPRIYFASDLYDTVYRDVVFKNLRVEQLVFGAAAATVSTKGADALQQTRDQAPDLVTTNE